MSVPTPPSLMCSRPPVWPPGVGRYPGPTESHWPEGEPGCPVCQQVELLSPYQ